MGLDAGLEQRGPLHASVVIWSIPAGLQRHRFMHTALRRLVLAAALTAVAEPCGAQVSLAARYRLDESAGATLVDEGPHNLTGTYTGGFALAQPGAAAGTASSVRFVEASLGHADIAN